MAMAEDVELRQYASVKLYDPPRRPGRREICSSPRHRVCVHHPAYHSTRLFEISAFDGKSGGIHHGTLLLLCGIIAGGVWNGWLSEEKKGTRLTAGFEDVLTQPDYFFHLPKPSTDSDTCSIPYKWPVVMSLDDMSFPHGRPPPGFTFDDPETTSFYSSASVSNMSQAVRDRDMTCRVTRWADRIQRAHLCSRSAADWFTREELERYNMSASLSGGSSIDDMANAIALRQDVHTELDKGTFIFVRKVGKWVPHFLSPTHDLGPEFHDVPIDMPASVSEAFILTNIFRAILPRISNFLIRGEKRRVIVKRGTEPPQIKEMTGVEIRTMLNQSKRERSKSPRKRSRNLDELGVAPDVKRPCLNWSPQELQEISTTPTLTASSISPEPEISRSIAPIELLRQQGLRKQRRLNKTHSCCDYDAAEAALRNNREAEPVCIRCLGVEIIEEIHEP